jgi:hypothetical protein
MVVFSPTDSASDSMTGGEDVGQSGLFMRRLAVARERDSIDGDKKSRRPAT